MQRLRIALLLTEFQTMLDRFAVDSALRHDLASVNRLEAITSLLSECLGEGAVRLMLVEALYRSSLDDHRGQRARQWQQFITRRRQILELVIAGRHKRLRTDHYSEPQPQALSAAA